MTGIIVIFFINGKKLSSHMAQISEKLTSQIKNPLPWSSEKNDFNLGSKKCKNNNNSTCQINHIQFFLLISIVDTLEKDVSNIDRKLYKKQMYTSSINSSSTLFYCSIRVMYIIVHRDQNKCLMLKSYITGIITSILPNKNYEIYFMKN